MSNPVARCFRSSVSGLRRRPVLAAMMVYSIGLAAAALVVTIAVWRSASSCPDSRRPEHLYLVRITPSSAGHSDPGQGALIS
jgi:hypothetical protein